jgi:hypothetical protein
VVLGDLQGKRGRGCGRGSLRLTAQRMLPMTPTARPAKGPGDHARRETMIGNLKVLLGGALVALVAFGVLGAGAAVAVEQFHCEVEPCTLTLAPDGTGATAHQVLNIKNAVESSSLTCESLSGDATSAAKTTEELTFTNLVYSNCKLAGVVKFSIRMNSCHYLFTSKTEPAGGANGTGGGATIHIQCETEKHIEFENTGTGCIFEVTPQTLRGAHYHTIGFGTSKEITVEMRIGAAVSGTTIAVEVAKVGTGCVPKANVGDTLSGEITTGNLLITAEKDNANKEMVGAWWE